MPDLPAIAPPYQPHGHPPRRHADPPQRHLHGPVLPPATASAASLKSTSCSASSPPPVHLPPAWSLEARLQHGRPHRPPWPVSWPAKNRSMMAFEPQPVIFQQLCANLALNGLMNVTALPYACGSEPGVSSPFKPPTTSHPRQLRRHGHVFTTTSAPSTQLRCKPSPAALSTSFVPR